MLHSTGDCFPLGAMAHVVLAAGSRSAPNTGGGRGAFSMGIVDIRGMLRSAAKTPLVYCPREFRQHLDRGALEQHVCQSPARRNDLERPAGLGQELIERLRFVLPSLEFVEIEICPDSDVGLEEIKRGLGGGIEIGIEIHKQLLMRRHDAPRKGFAEPTFEERHTRIFDDRNNPIHREMPFLSAEIPRLR